LAKGSTTIDRRGTDVVAGGGTPATSIAKDAHRPRDVLELLLAEIAEGEVELAGHVLLHPRRDADPAWIGQPFEPGRDVHPVTENVAVLDNDITHIEADAEINPFCDSDPGIAPSHCLLHLGRAAQGVYHAAELYEQTVARRFDQPTVMRGDLRIDHLGTD
jgi:hypothetical protein